MLTPPRQDPGVLFDLFRSNFATELLTAAVAHFGVFKALAERPLAQEEFAKELGLAARPATVLSCALASMGLIRRDRERWTLTDLAADHLVAGRPHDIGGYVSLMADAPGVLALVERLKTNRPADSDGKGAAYIYRDGIKSAMESEALARHFTLALAGRARNMAPVLAEKLDWCECRRVLDVGAGSGYFAIALAERWPQLTAIALDRPEVLKIAKEIAAESPVAARVEFLPGDMFADPFPEAYDAILLSNVLHDWDVPECQRLVAKCAVALRPGGRLIVHDVLLNDALDGPLNIAYYSAALFSLTEGRAYSEREYRGWLQAAGLLAEPTVPTLTYCHAVVGRKPR